MPTDPDLETLLRQRDELKTQLASVGDMRPGSLVACFRKRGKPSCHCAKEDDPGHGPSYSLTHAVAGKTVTHVIPARAAVERTRKQLREYHCLRELLRQLIAVSEQICGRQLRRPPETGVKKRARRATRR